MFILMFIPTLQILLSFILSLLVLMNLWPSNLLSWHYIPTSWHSIPTSINSRTTVKQVRAQPISWSQVLNPVMIPLFPFTFYFTIQSLFHSIPFGPCFLPIPMSLLHEALLVSLIYDSQTSRLTSFSSLALPCTAKHCLMTHTDSLSPWGCASPLFPFRMTHYDSNLIFSRTTLSPTVYV